MSDFSEQVREYERRVAELDDTIQYERQQVQWYGGQVSGWGSAVEYILEKAGKAFSDERDSDARFLRALAKEMEDALPVRGFKANKENASDKVIAARDEKAGLVRPEKADDESL